MSDDHEHRKNFYGLDDVCDRLDNIETAIKARHTDFGWIGLLIFGWLVWIGLSSLWNSKTRYSLWYSVSDDQITIEREPTDCDFFSAPMGKKGCHYDRKVSTVKVKIEGAGLEQAPLHYVSFDDGETWSIDDANPPTKPQVIVSWEKAEDE